jgi:hypothetical protein
MRQLGFRIAVVCLTVALPSQVFAKAKMCERFDETCLEKLIANPPILTKERRLPKGTKIGRCLLEVDGQTRISGPCAYSIEKGGGFHIDGPRAVYGGIDYADPEGSTVFMITTDFWANVFKDQDGKWTGYGNEDPSYSKGEGSAWYELVKNGACYSNETKRQPSDTYQQLVKVCLWKEWRP